MDNKLPQVYKKSIFAKIKDFFKNIFSFNDYEEKKEIVIPTERRKIDFINDLNEQDRKEKIKDDIISNIDASPEIIETLDTERLKELIILYEEKIQKNNIKINILKREIRNLSN